MAPPSASAVGSHMGGPSASPPLGTRAQFRRQGSSYGHSHVHHMALMVAPKRIDYSVNKGGLKTWIVLIVFVLLCSAILTIFSEENESELANEAPVADQKEVNEEEDIEGEANIPAAAIAGGGEREGDDDDDDDGDEDEEKEEEEEEEDQEEKIKQRQNAKHDDDEERMLARLKEAAAMARRRQKEEAKLKARKEAEKRQQRKAQQEKEEEEEEEKEEEEERGEREKEKEKGKEEEIGNNKDNDDEEEETERGQSQEEEEEEGEEEEQYIWERSRHGKKEKRVPSWRDTQLQAAKEDTRKPRMNLLKQRKKVKKSNDHTEEEERGEEQDEEEDDEAQEETEEENVFVGELIATRKRPIYNRKALTNRYDYKHRSQLDVADSLVEKHEFDVALKHYEQILATNKHSPRALFGRGRLHQLKAEFGPEYGDDSEKFLRLALSDYNSVLENEDTPDELFKMTMHYFVECAKLVGGHYHKILLAQRALMDRFPDDADIKCDFGATWLGMARPEKAADIFRNVLDMDPGHALALAYLGYIQKVHEGELERGVHALRRAMRTGDERVAGDARFYFHLGDGLVKLGRNREALGVYADAVGHGLFPSVLQRSIHNMMGLAARPWWTVEQSECAKQLKATERQWTAIREEALKVWNKRKSLFVEEALPIASGMIGGELALTLKSNAIGGFREEICEKLMQSTCEILKQFESASCAKDKIKLSVLLAGTRTWPFCGPTNYVLEAHLGLVAHSDARIRVGNETRGWRPGRFLVYDTSFEREMNFEGAHADAVRLALTLELWHPQMPMELRGKFSADGADEDKK